MCHGANKIQKKETGNFRIQKVGIQNSETGFQNRETGILKVENWTVKLGKLGTVKLGTGKTGKLLGLL